MKGEGWICPTCNQVWAPWFVGPCTHGTTTATNTVTLDHQCRPKDKSQMTDATQECEVCGALMTFTGVVGSLDGQ